MRPLLRLPKPIIILTHHLRPQTNQQLLNPHIPIPRFDSSNSAFIDISIRIDAIHVDFCDELDMGWYDGVVFGDGYFEIVDSIFKGSLRHGWYSLVVLDCIVCH